MIQCTKHNVWFPIIKVEVPFSRGVRIFKARNTWHMSENQVSPMDHVQVPKETGPGVRNSKRPLSACQNCRECSMETLWNSVFWHQNNFGYFHLISAPLSSTKSKQIKSIMPHPWPITCLKLTWKVTCH